MSGEMCIVITVVLYLTGHHDEIPSIYIMGLVEGLAISRSPLIILVKDSWTTKNYY